MFRVLREVLDLQEVYNYTNQTETIEWLEQVDTTFIDEYAVQRSTSNTSFTGEPKYWANWDSNTLIVAPTPNCSLYS